MHVSEFSQYEEGSLCEIIHIDNVLILFKLQIKYISHGIVFINLKKKRVTKFLVNCINVLCKYFFFFTNNKIVIKEIIKFPVMHDSHLFASVSKNVFFRGGIFQASFKQNYALYCYMFYFI